ncbi:protein FAR1-RELATED SEQUENCE 5-like [Nymphaea colorata]|nr:protein FAR1-RELATED SEQUENCE 5-like [Nymphaea colorata]XP_031477426.1 protein FAR1-RELATED SEQUENCE 5-like [Nymphaea colorata]XP_031477430.1 protein FAR1-RELATED SEQUENCE 5-like [Nymphaea colorata]XP_031477431.1 protein FAR1-RELATED SEQUENCE 5-like [Nymphaea colorata]XP_031477432.1 protein FAR1-RELATED SEQUENCE 5-like [Nymphaea colorata]XP_049932295.1 protein FAR1-RELATED SEQUENCE 5-like [Nymphaea colorata]XP_049932296.1 protein FAR1-RELATED SEQUENCE 5-like [Nymphaea colorata]XP_04993229
MDSSSESSSLESVGIVDEDNINKGDSHEWYMVYDVGDFTGINALDFFDSDIEIHYDEETRRSSTSLYQGLGEGQANADINLVNLAFHGEALQHRSNHVSHMQVQQSSKNLQNCHANELDVRIAMGKENNEEDDRSCEIDLPSSSVFQGLAPYVGLRFKSVDMARSFYDAYAKREGFTIRTMTNAKSTKDNKTIIGHVFCCSKEGRSRRKENPIKPKNNIMTPRSCCRARMAVRKKLKNNIEEWEITVFVKEHNHELVSPSRGHNFRPQCSITSIARSLPFSSEMSIANDALLTSKKKSTNGSENLGFTDKDTHNYLLTARRLMLAREDAQNVIDYFQRMQAEDPGFLYAVKFDKYGFMKYFFWVDGRSRNSYSCFCDVVTFDSTYKKNKYKIPFAPFVGVNHHLQTVLLGCGLLFEENEKAFKWLFRQWLQAMSGKAPLTIITNHALPIERAIEKCFPTTHHAFCTWHVLKEVWDKLNKMCNEHDGFRKMFFDCVKDSLTVEEFEQRWDAFVTGYDLREKEWIQSLYNIRQKWVPAYLRSAFFAGMSTTQKRESINAFLKNFMNSSTGLFDFVKNFQRALLIRYDAEEKFDFESSSRKPSLAYNWEIETKAASLYTRAVFVKFLNQLKEVNRCKAKEILRENEKIKFEVTHGDDGWVYVVDMNISNSNVACTCRNFEYTGILCMHVLKIFQRLDVTDLPNHYFLRRYTMDAKKTLHKDVHGVDVLANSNISIKSRHNLLCQRAMKFAIEACSSTDTFDMAMKLLDGAFERLANMNKRAFPLLSVQGHDNSLTDKEAVFHPLTKRQKGELEGDHNALEWERIQRPKRKCKVCSGTGHDKRNCPTRVGRASEMRIMDMVAP